jgi:hypothetical protein
MPYTVPKRSRAGEMIPDWLKEADPESKSRPDGQVSLPHILEGDQT